MYYLSDVVAYTKQSKLRHNFQSNLQGVMKLVLWTLLLIISAMLSMAQSITQRPYRSIYNRTCFSCLYSRLLPALQGTNQQYDVSGYLTSSAMNSKQVHALSIINTSI